MPCPHHDIKIIQRSNHQSAVASAAYQSGERLFSEYDQKQKYYSHKSEIVHTEIMLPPTEEILALVDKKCDSLTELQAQLPELLAVCGD